uniref:Uncharacterized protein n=1 Tax=Arundo donax TaxID=35708 RepID=A0A0A8ZHR9_ARUDO
MACIFFSYGIMSCLRLGLLFIVPLIAWCAWVHKLRCMYCTVYLPIVHVPFLSTAMVLSL